MLIERFRNWITTILGIILLLADILLLVAKYVDTTAFLTIAAFAVAMIWAKNSFITDLGKLGKGGGTAVVIALVLLTSCRTQKPPVVTSTDSTSVTAKPRPVVIPAVQDSSSIKALFECDSNNRVILKSYNSLWSKYMSVNSVIIPADNGGMSVSIETNTNHPATTATANDSIIYREKKIYLPGAAYPVYTERDLSWLQKTLMYAGAAALLLLLLFVVKQFYNPFK